MKLTGELKDKVESVETMDAKKAIVAEAGMELTDEELEVIAGGKSNLVKKRFDLLKSNYINKANKLSEPFKSMCLSELDEAIYEAQITQIAFKYGLPQ